MKFLTTLIFGMLIGVALAWGSLNTPQGRSAADWFAGFVAPYIGGGGEADGTAAP